MVGRGDFGVTELLKVIESIKCVNLEWESFGHERVEKKQTTMKKLLKTNKEKENKLLQGVNPELTDIKANRPSALAKTPAATVNNNN